MEADLTLRTSASMASRAVRNRSVFLVDLSDRVAFLVREFPEEESVFEFSEGGLSRLARPAVC
jgi:hypothetical protein